MNFNPVIQLEEQWEFAKVSEFVQGGLKWLIFSDHLRQNNRSWTRELNRITIRRYVADTSGVVEEATNRPLGQRQANPNHSASYLGKLEVATC